MRPTVRRQIALLTKSLIAQFASIRAHLLVHFTFVIYYTSLLGELLFASLHIARERLVEFVCLTEVIISLFCSKAFVAHDARVRPFQCVLGAKVLL